MKKYATFKQISALIAVLICFAIILPFITACNNDNSETTNNDNQDNQNTGDNNNSDSAANEPHSDEPDLPKVDMGGKTFTFLTSNWGGDESENISRDIAFIEEATGDTIDDASLARRIKIEQQYNCNIRQFTVNDPADAVQTYQRSILAGDGSYDVGITTGTNFSTMLTGNYLVDIKDLPHIDVNKPYWSKNFYDAMSIMGKNFALDGDISMRRLQCVWIMAFNKQMIADNNFESPFDLVKNGKWTYGKMHEMAKQVAKDLNGDGNMTREDDLWGINYTGDTIMGIINSVGVRIAETDANGIPQLTIATEVNLEKLMRIFTDMRDNTYSIDTLFKSGGGVTGIADAKLFSENRCLFLACASHNVRQVETETGEEYGLRSMESDFGIIPYPKWDEAQAEYTPFTAGNYHPVLSVPQTNGDLENTSIILEAMAYEGKKTISPAFYESLLKTKTARDNESAEMIDYIFGNLTYDVGVMYNFGEVLGTFGYEMSTNLRANIVSTIEKNENLWQKAIDDLISEIENAG